MTESLPCALRKPQAACIMQVLVLTALNARNGLQPTG